MPEAIVGAGTIRSVADARAALDAGCRFGVSPGYTPTSARACRDIGLPLLPGVATASEVMAANADGLPLPEVLPGHRGRRHPDAQGAGRALSPTCVFCPTGGITPETAPQFLALPNVRVCGGSWLTPQDAVDAAGLGAHHAAGARAAAALR